MQSDDEHAESDSGQTDCCRSSFFDGLESPGKASDHPGLVRPTVWETAWEERESAPPDPLSTLLVDDQGATLVADVTGEKVWLASAVEEATREVLEDEVWQVGGRRPRNLRDYARTGS